MLYGYLYDQSLTSPALVRRLGTLSGLRILFELPGGVQAIEFDFGASEAEAYFFYESYVGYRVVVLDGIADKPVAEGWIYGVALSQVGCKVLCKGAWYRHFDEFDDTDYPMAQTSSSVLKASLTNFVPVSNSDQTNVAETSFTLGTLGQTWDFSQYGLFPGDLIIKLASMSDAALSQWNYWMQSAPFNATTPQKPLSYFVAQVDDGTVNWQIQKRDMAASSGLTMERNIDELGNNITVIYRDISNSEQAITAWSADTDSQASFWLREIVLSGGEMTTDGATQYRDLMLSKLKQPLFKRAFTISSREIMDGYGYKWPLWQVIKNCGGYMRINDLYPSADMFTNSLDGKRSGQIMTAEYDDTNYTLRISLDTQDDSTSAILAQMEAAL